MNILITGGASGVGYAITKKLASNPHHKIFISFNSSITEAKQLEADHSNVSAIHCDFRNPSDIKNISSEMAKMDLDVLINNALIGMTKKHFHKISNESFLDSFHQNVLPTLKITQQAILAFRKKHAGKIITILSSYLINRPPIGLSEYVANKAYLQSMSKSWANENSQYNITSNCVLPSMMKTNLTSDIDERIVEGITESHPFGELLSTLETADVVAFLVAATKHINGTNLIINGGIDVI